MSTDQSAALKPCPFCGGEAKRVDNLSNKEQLAAGIARGQDFDDGGSFIECTKCGNSTGLHFDRRDNLDSAWNDREPLLVENIRISIEEDGLVYIRSIDGEGGMFDLTEFAQCVRGFVSDRL